MKEKEILELLFRSGVIMENVHVSYSSGLHGSVYVNKDVLLPDIERTKSVAEALAKKIAKKGIKVETVLGPAPVGAIFAREVGRALACIMRKNVYAVYAEKRDDKEFFIGRGQGRFVKEKKVLVVEDIINTGESAKKVIEAARRCEGNVVGVGALLNRGGVSREDLGVPFLVSLVSMILEAWAKKDCPLCEKGVPLYSRSEEI